jgi:hypothetical protein
MQKKKTDTFKMKSNKRQIEIQVDFHIGLKRLGRQFNMTRKTNTEEKRKSPRYAFLKISVNAHLQSRTIQCTTQALQKSQILPTLKTSII